MSIVAAPWRRFVQAARWNGAAAHTTTGPDSASAIHCQYVNCHAGTIDSATTGTVSAIEVISRSRSGSASAAGTGSSAGRAAV